MPDLRLPAISHSFSRDYDALTAGLRPGYAGAPYSFVRYGDGEYAIMTGTFHRAKTDGWKWRNGETWISRALRTTISDAPPGYYVGIVSEPHNPTLHHRLLRLVGTPQCNVTFAELFCFANYRRWKGEVAEIVKGCCVVGSYDTADIQVPARPQQWTEGLVEQVVREMMERCPRGTVRPFIFAAGPMSNIVIWEYWRATQGTYQKPYQRQVVVDVGSAMDEHFGRFKTRHHHWMRLRISRWKPNWKMRHSDDLLITRLRTRGKRKLPDVGHVGQA